MLDFVAAQELRGADDQFCFDLKDSQDLLRQVKDYPLLEKENAKNEQTIKNLEEQNSNKDELLKIAEERRKVQEERAEFYKEMFEKQSQVSKKYEELVDKMEKKEERKKILEGIGGAILIAIGVFVGLAF